MPSASDKMPPCHEGRRHRWRMSIGRTVRLRNAVAETCRICGLRRIVTDSGRVRRDG